jgi:hypothetical protein
MNGEEAKFYVKEEVITHPKIFRLGTYSLEKEKSQPQAAGISRVLAQKYFYTDL